MKLIRTRAHGELKNTKRKSSRKGEEKQVPGRCAQEDSLKRAVGGKKGNWNAGIRGGGVGNGPGSPQMGKKETQDREGEGKWRKAREADSGAFGMFCEEIP